MNRISIAFYKSFLHLSLITAFLFFSEYNFCETTRPYVDFDIALGKGTPCYEKFFKEKGDKYHSFIYNCTFTNIEIYNTFKKIFENKLDDTSILQ